MRGSTAEEMLKPQIPLSGLLHRPVHGGHREVSSGADRFNKHLREAIFALADSTISTTTTDYTSAERHLRDALKEAPDGARAERLQSLLSRHTAGWQLTRQEKAHLRNKLNDLLESRSLLRDPVDTRFLNIVVIGESGLGKSTFLQTFFDIDEVKREVVRERTREIISPVGREIKSGAPFLIRLFDSAGWGDELSIENKINEIIGCILRNNEEYDNDRRAGKPDTRYHCCFYFIAPHRCKGIDVEFMRRLANHIIVVPIIAKADAMTIEETNRFKEIIDEQLMDIPTYPFNPRPLPDGSTPHKAYAIIGSDGVVEAAREADTRYNWGTAFVRNPAHSDFVRLETEVFANYGQLLEAANDYYNRWLGDRTKLKIDRWLTTVSRWIERHCIALLLLMSLVIIAVVLGGWMMWTMLGITGACLLLWVALALGLHTRCASVRQDFARVDEEEEPAEAV